MVVFELLPANPVEEDDSEKAAPVEEELLLDPLYVPFPTMGSSGGSTGGIGGGIT